MESTDYRRGLRPCPRVAASGVCAAIVLRCVTARAAFDLQRGVGDAELLAQVLAERVDEQIVELRLRSHQVRGEGDLAAAERPDVQVVHGGDTGLLREE